MKILVVAELPEAALQQLRALGSDLDYAPDCTVEQLRDQVTDAGVLIVRDVRVGRDVIARGQKLQLIVHAGHGPGEIALDAASNEGIFVVHCPDRHANAVAELVFGLLVALDRQIVESTKSLRDGRWNRGELRPARGLAGRTLGVLGYDAAGREVARLARSFGMHVAAWCPTLTLELGENPEVELCNYPRELARMCDVIVVHTIADAQQLPLVDAAFLDCMPRGACLIHVGNPAAIDEPALAVAVRNRELRVALDSFNSEPTGDSGRFKSELFELPGVIGTPHVAALTVQAAESTAAEVVRLVRNFLVSGQIEHCLNLAERSPATWQLVLRVRDQVGVMASILDAIRADGVNAEEITSRVFTGAKAAWCTIALDERPSKQALDAVRALGDVLHLELRAVL